VSALVQDKIYSARRQVLPENGKGFKPPSSLPHTSRLFPEGHEPEQEQSEPQHETFPVSFR